MNSVEEKSGVTEIPKYIDNISFNKNNQLVVAASNLTGKFWNGLMAVFNQAQFAPNIPHIDYASINDAGCTNIEWIDQTRFVVGTDNGTVEVWELKDPPVIENSIMLPEHDDICSSVSVSLHSKQILSSSWDNCVKLWDLQVDLSIHTVRIHTDKVLDVSWNRLCSDLFASASEDGTVKIYDNRNNGKPAGLLSYTDVSFPVCLDWIDENLLYIGYNNGSISIQDLRAPNKNISSFSDAHTKTVNKVLSISNNNVASASDDMTVKVFNRNNWDLIYCDSRHTDYVRSLAYNEDSLWSCAWDGFINSHSLSKDITMQTP